MTLCEVSGRERETFVGLNDLHLSPQTIWFAPCFIQLRRRHATRALCRSEFRSSLRVCDPPDCYKTSLIPEIARDVCFWFI